MSSRKRSYDSRRTGPASFKRAKFNPSAATVRKQTNQVEVKRHQTGFSSPTPPDPYHLEQFGTIDAGTGPGDRDGRTIKQLYSEVNIHVDASESMRMILFKWNNALVLPDVSNILLNFGTSYGCAGYNVNYAGTYQVVKDVWLQGGGAPSHTHRYVVKHPFTQTYFNTGDDDVANTALYCLLVSPDESTLLPYKVGIATSYCEV